MTAVKNTLQVESRSLIKLERTSFADENIQERAHLQAALRDHIDLRGQRDVGAEQQLRRQVPRPVQATPNGGAAGFAVYEEGEVPESLA